MVDAVGSSKKKTTMAHWRGSVSHMCTDMSIDMRMGIYIGMHMEISLAEAVIDYGALAAMGALLT